MLCNKLTMKLNFTSGESSPPEEFLLIIALLSKSVSEDGVVQALLKISTKIKD